MKRGDTLVTAGPSELDALIILADGKFTAAFVQMRSPVAYSPSKENAGLSSSQFFIVVGIMLQRLRSMAGS